MATVSNTELNNMIVRYAAANEEKKPLVKECNALSAEIKDALEERGATTFTAMGWTATVTFRTNKKPNLDKIKALLNKKQLAEFEKCFDEVVTPILTVAAEKVAANTKAA